MNKHKGIQVIGTEELIKTQFLDLMATEFIGMNGKTGYWTWCHRPENRQAVVIAAVVSKPKIKGYLYVTDLKLVVTKEFRVPLYFNDKNPYEYGFPAGLIDENESPEEAAKRELFEETGLDVKKVIRVSPFLYNSPGITDESIAMVYVEAEGAISQDKNENSEEIETMLLSKQEIVELMKDSTKKIGAKAYMVMERFVAHGDI